MLYAWRGLPKRGCHSLGVGGVEAEDDAEEDGEEGVAEVEHEVSDPDPVDGEEEADLDLAEGNRGVLVKEG